jgi:hypothetical protein
MCQMCVLGALEPGGRRRIRRSERTGMDGGRGGRVLGQRLGGDLLGWGTIGTRRRCIYQQAGRWKHLYMGLRSSSQEGNTTFWRFGQVGLLRLSVMCKSGKVRVNHPRFQSRPRIRTRAERATSRQVYGVSTRTSSTVHKSQGHHPSRRRSIQHAGTRCVVSKQALASPSRQVAARRPCPPPGLGSGNMGRGPADLEFPALVLAWPHHTRLDTSGEEGWGMLCKGGRVLYRCINACDCHVFHHIVFGNSPIAIQGSNI